VTDEHVLTAVGAEQAWMEDLLVRLVEAPTTLGDEDPGHVDVVPPAAAHLWSSPPFTARRDGRTPTWSSGPEGPRRRRGT
jgi:hypothetical protein